MPKNQFQRAIFALITVVITVHAYVFYSLYVVNGDKLMEITGASSVIKAIKAQGGVYMLGRYMPIWAVILIEFCLAYGLELAVGSPYSFKLASKVFDLKNTNPAQFETAVICATVGLMCPTMSFLAAILYYPYYAGFNFFTLLANWLKLVCFNFPFAYFSQLFFIQPLVRTIFKLIFVRSVKTQPDVAAQKQPAVSYSTSQPVVVASSEVVTDVLRLVDEIKIKLSGESDFSVTSDVQEYSIPKYSDDNI